jgi:hypothetical protein
MNCNSDYIHYFFQIFICLSSSLGWCKNFVSSYQFACFCCNFKSIMFSLFGVFSWNPFCYLCGILKIMPFLYFLALTFNNLMMYIKIYKKYDSSQTYHFMIQQSKSCKIHLFIIRVFQTLISCIENTYDTHIYRKM